MSKSKIKSINFSINEFMKGHKERMSFSHYHGMSGRLKAMFLELHQMGYETTHLDRIKQKHIAILVKHWQEKGIGVSTIKNRMSDLRFICKEHGRHNVVKSNDEYSIGKRTYQPTKNKAIEVEPSRIGDHHVATSVRLQQLFGLRREEAIKIIPHQADRGDYLYLQGSWTKGGIERKVPIRTQGQRDALEAAKKITEYGESLIPKDKNYIQQRRVYDRVTHEAGFRNLHGLRHAYAQSRYKELTGWAAPIAGGPTRKSLNKEQTKLDRLARAAITKELGHSRVAIAKNYLG